MTEQSYIARLAQAARAASFQIAQADSAAKNAALLLLAILIDENRERIFAANARDLENGTAKGLSDALLDRLKITEGSLKTRGQQVPTPRNRHHRVSFLYARQAIRQSWLTQ